MFNQGGLSLEQAPPISVVFRFFITGSIFGVSLGLFLIGSYFGLFEISDYSKELIATHLLFLGVEASFMIGALFQMLPVLAGVVIKVPEKKSLIVNTLLIIGIISQALSFYSAKYYLFTAITLGGILLYVTLLMLKELVKVKSHSNSSLGMAFAIGGFGITIIIGIFMLLSLGVYLENIFDFSKIRTLHYSFGLIGWIFLLIASISFQVIEMFFVTPKYPPLISKYYIGAIFSLLILKLLLISYNYNSIIDKIIGALTILYGTTTLYLLYKRKRPTSDASVWFWRLAMGLLVLFGISIFFNNLELSYMLFVGFSISVIFAMVYKIVPFLVWFHLSSQGYMEAPMMHEVIRPKVAKIHFFLHTISIFILLANILYKPLEPVVYILTIISFGLLGWNIVGGSLKYKNIQKKFTPIEW